MNMMTNNEILEVYNQGPASVVELVKGLFAKIDDLVAENKALREEIAELKAENKVLRQEIVQLKTEVKKLKDQINQNSNNSSKPPSCDGFKKIPNLRQKSGKPTGGQIGHQGYTLRQTSNPDYVQVYKLPACPYCNSSLVDVNPQGYTARQVFDIPPVKIEVTEHRAEIKRCPHCGKTGQAEFLAGIEQPVQYGQRIKALATYLTQYQLIPLDRTCELLSDVLDTPISEGTLVNINNRCYAKLESAETQIMGQLKASRILNNDETGCSIEGRRYWLHVASNDKLTHYAVHNKRGSQATGDIGILPGFSGTAVHDYWKAYLKYDNCSHALCNAHHLRALTGIEENDNQQWPKQMKQLLLKMKEEVDTLDFFQNL